MLHNRAFYIPKNSIPFQIEGFPAIVYFEEGKNGKPYAVGFRGNAQKPAFNFSFSDVARRSAYCFSFLCDEAEREERKVERKAEKKAVRAAFVNPLKVGDVLHYSWGYEQTNPEFWQVVEANGKTVIIQEIAQRADEERNTGNGMAEYRFPVFDQFIGDPIKKTVQPNGEGTGCHISFKHGTGSFWGNREKPGSSRYCSWYY